MGVPELVRQDGEALLRQTDLLVDHVEVATTVVLGLFNDADLHRRVLAQLLEDAKIHIGDGELALFSSELDELVREGPEGDQGRHQSWSPMRMPSLTAIIL